MSQTFFSPSGEFFYFTCPSSFYNQSFETAAKVFLDENKIDEFDEIHSDFEDRFKIIGRVGKILTVIYTERGERNRIISARRADKDEEDEYYEQFNYL